MCLKSFDFFQVDILKFLIDQSYTMFLKCITTRPKLNLKKNVAL